MKNFLPLAQSLQKLDLSEMQLPRYSLLIDVIDVLTKQTRQIQYLNLGGNSVQGIPNNARPDVIALSDRLISVLAPYIKESQTLVHLNLSGCFIGL